MLSDIIQILNSYFPAVFTVYFLVGVSLAGFLHLQYNRPILQAREKIDNIEKEHSKITGLKSIREPRLEAQLKPLRKQIDAIEIRRRFFLDTVHVIYPWIR